MVTLFVELFVQTVIISPRTYRCLLTGSRPPCRCHVTRGTGHASAAHSSVTVSPSNESAIVSGVHVKRGLIPPDGADHINRNTENIEQ